MRYDRQKNTENCQAFTCRNPQNQCTGFYDMKSGAELSNKFEGYCLVYYADGAEPARYKTGLLKDGQRYWTAENFALSTV